MPGSRAGPIPGAPSSFDTKSSDAARALPALGLMQQLCAVERAVSRVARIVNINTLRRRSPPCLVPVNVTSAPRLGHRPPQEPTAQPFPGHRFVVHAYQKKPRIFSGL